MEGRRQKQRTKNENKNRSTEIGQHYMWKQLLFLWKWRRLREWRDKYVQVDNHRVLSLLDWKIYQGSHQHDSNLFLVMSAEFVCQIPFLHSPFQHDTMSPYLPRASLFHQSEYCLTCHVPRYSISQIIDFLAALRAPEKRFSKLRLRHLKSVQKQTKDHEDNSCMFHGRGQKVALSRRKEIVSVAQ